MKRCHQPDQQFLDKLPWGRWKMVDELTVFRFDWKKCGKIIGLVMEIAVIGKTLRNVSS